MNDLRLSGRVLHRSDLSTTQSGAHCCNVIVEAEHRRFVAAIKVSVYGDLAAKICRTVHPGQLVEVDGHAQTGRWAASGIYLVADSIAVVGQVGAER